MARTWLVQKHRDLVDAAFVINPDAGGVELDHGRTVVADVEATEKVYADYQVTAINRGGHSSLPRPDNAIYELTAALNKLAAYSFPFELNEVTRTYFENLVEAGDWTDGGRHSRHPGHAARSRRGRPSQRRAQLQLQLPHHLRGHAALRRPRQQRAAANRAGQRELPHLSRPLARGDSPAAHRVFGDSQLTVKYVSDAGVVSDTAPERKAIVPPAPIKEVFEPLTRITQAIWPGIPVTPVMENGASDSIYFAQAGIPCYGYSAIALERDDDRAHGQDERLPVDSYWKSLDFFYAFARELGGQ